MFSPIEPEKAAEPTMIKVRKRGFISVVRSSKILIEEADISVEKVTRTIERDRNQILSACFRRQT